jgi:hypothetical protein
VAGLLEGGQVMLGADLQPQAPAGYPMAVAEPQVQ